MTLGDHVKKVFTQAKSSYMDGLDVVLPKLKEKYRINTVDRLAYFICQCAHESAYFKTFEEYASGAAYEGRADLGNVQRGDGVRFKGRGAIQITGRSNYFQYGRVIGIDLISNPKAASSPTIGWEVSAAYWKTRGLNELADKGSFYIITKRINGSGRTNAQRLKYLQRCLDLVRNSGAI